MKALEQVVAFDWVKVPSRNTEFVDAPEHIAAALLPNQ